MLSAAADAEDQKKARLKAERQAEYNKFLHDKESQWQQKGVRAVTKLAPALAVPPNLVGHEEYYGAEIADRGQFGPMGQDRSKEEKLQQQRQYAQELQEQARNVADRKRIEKERSRAESRELLIQRGELNPTDNRQQQAGDHGYGHRQSEDAYGGGPGYSYDNNHQGRGAPGYGAYAAGPPTDFSTNYPPARGRDAPPGMYHKQADPAEAMDFAQHPPRGGRGMPEPYGGAAVHQLGPPSHNEQRDGGDHHHERQQELDHLAPSLGSRANHPSFPGGNNYGHDFHGQQHGYVRADYRSSPYNLQAAGGGPVGVKAGMVFGNPFGATMQMKTAANQKKAAYREELEQQMRAVSERKAAEKRSEQEIEAKRERDAMASGYQVGWGNNRGGGGAPHRDNAGNIITDLKKAGHAEAHPGLGSGPPAAAVGVRMPPPPGADPGRYGMPPSTYHNGPPPGQPYGGPTPPPDAAGGQAPLGNFRSDHAYMLPQEIEAKARAQRQMQEELQRQIEEKKRAKEEEKRKEQEEERREIERLAREQDELRANFAAEAQDKKSKAAEEAEELRRMAEEAYVKAQAKKPGNRDSYDGPPFRPAAEPNQGRGVGNSFDSIPVGLASAAQQAHMPPDQYGADFSQQEPARRRPSSRGDPQSHPPGGGGGHHRPSSSRAGGRTAAEIAKLKEEMSAAQAQMRLAMEQRMREVTQRQEDEMRELRKRAEHAEAEVAGIKKAVTSRPPKTPPTFGRRASPPSSEGRRRWGAPEVELPTHIPAPSYAEAYQDYGDALRDSYGGGLRGSRSSQAASMSIDFGQSLSGESRLIFPGQAAATAQGVRDVSLSSLRPVPGQSASVRDSVKYPAARALRGAGGNAEHRQPSRLGTPTNMDSLDVGTVLAKNQDRTKFLDALDNAQDEGGTSDALDDLLTKFVELENPIPLPPGKGPPEHSMSLRGDSEWISGGNS